MKKSIRIARRTRASLLSKEKQIEFDKRHLTTKKSGPFGDSVQAIIDAVNTPSDIAEAVPVDTEIIKEVDRVAAALFNLKCLPPIFVYANRSWGYVRVSHIEFNSWNSRQKKAFNNAMSKIKLIRDGEKLKWQWSQKHTKSGCMVLKGCYSGHGINRYPVIIP